MRHHENFSTIFAAFALVDNVFHIAHRLVWTANAGRTGARRPVVHG